MSDTKMQFFLPRKALLHWRTAAKRLLCHPFGSDWERPPGEPPPDVNNGC